MLGVLRQVEECAGGAQNTRQWLVQIMSGDEEKAVILTGAIQVDPEDAKRYARDAARLEGMLVGISSGATLAAIAKKLEELPADARVIGFNYDTGERYFSVPDFLPEA